jgi:hypothetical protein
MNEIINVLHNNLVPLRFHRTEKIKVRKNQKDNQNESMNYFTQR